MKLIDLQIKSLQKSVNILTTTCESLLILAGVQYNDNPVVRELIVKLEKGLKELQNLHKQEQFLILIDESLESEAYTGDTTRLSSNTSATES